jgi:phosphatidylserine/phosphatidylglycerophosphate/cardiolipin synthase-like enzyme
MRNSIHKTEKTKRFSYTRNKVQLVRGGRDYFQTLEKMIKQARQSIHMQTYISKMMKQAG